MKKRWMIAGAVSGLITGASFAQERRQMVFTQAVPAPAIGVAGAAGPGDVVMFSTTGMAGGANVQFMSADMSFEGAREEGVTASSAAH